MHDVAHRRRRTGPEPAALAALVRVLPEYLAPGRPPLTAASFRRVARRGIGPRPPVETLEVPGGALAFRHYRAPDADVALVLVHGSGCFADLFHTMASRVSRAGAAHVFTLDMRGHGHAAGRPGRALAPGELTQDVSRFIAQVRRRLPGARVFLGGHSAGATAVIRIGTSRRAQKVDGFVLLAPFLGLGAAPNRPRFGGWVRPRLLPLAAATAAGALRLPWLNDMAVADFDTAAAQDPRYLKSWSFGTLCAFAPAWSLAARGLPRDRPVLVLALDDDECFDPRRYPAAFTSVAPQAEIPRLGRGGHWDLLVDARAIASLSGWLFKVTGRSALRAPSPSPAGAELEPAR